LLQAWKDRLQRELQAQDEVFHELQYFKLYSRAAGETSNKNAGAQAFTHGLSAATGAI
jgi:hypothetical protein